MPVPLSQQLTPEKLDSDENQAYIDAAIQRQTQQRVAAERMLMQQKRQYSGGQMTDRERAMLQPAAAPPPRRRQRGNEAARRLYRERVMEAKKKIPRSKSAAVREYRRQNTITEKDAQGLFSKLRRSAADVSVGTNTVSSAGEVGAAAPQTPEQAIAQQMQQRGQQIAGPGSSISNTIPKGGVGWGGQMPRALQEKYPNIPPDAYFPTEDLTKKDRFILRRLLAVGAQEREQMQRQAQGVTGQMAEPQ